MLVDLSAIWDAAAKRESNHWLMANVANPANLANSKPENPDELATLARLARLARLAISHGTESAPPAPVLLALADRYCTATQASDKARQDWRTDIEATPPNDRHGDSRFSDADALEDGRAVLVRDRGGYWRNTAQGRVYLFTATGMREALKGLDFNRALWVLEQAGLIGAPNDKGERARSQRVGGRKVRVYEVHPDGMTGAA